MSKVQKKIVFAIFFSITSLLFIPHAFSGGLYLSEVLSPVSLGTAGVQNVVNNISADAAYTNPAGMTGLERDEILSGLQFAIPSIRFDSSVATAGGSDSGNAGFVSAIPGLAYVKVLSEKLRAGISVTAPLGGGVDYGKRFVGRYQATRSVLSGLGITPAIAYKINDSLSIGAGVTALYSRLDVDVAVRQPGSPDGEVNIDKIDDWGAQGQFGLTWQVTDKAMLGFVYRTESSVDLDGDLSIKGIVGPPIVNVITGVLDDIELSFDYPQAFYAGLKYEATENIILMMDVSYEDWSEFSDFNIEITGGPIKAIRKADIEWDDTWGVGGAMIYHWDDHAVTAGLSYASSPVDDEDRNFALPMDEQVTIGASYVRFPEDSNFDYGVGLSYTWLGDGEIEQVAQGTLIKGDFSTNQIVFIGATARYLF